MRFVFLLLVPAAFGFQSSFNYGCQSGKCTYQLVVPKELAQYIDQKQLTNEVSTISQSLVKLNATIAGFGGSNTTDFTENFNAKYTVVNATAQDFSSNVQQVSQNASVLVADSANANYTAHLLYDSISCFQSNTSSYKCFSRPSTLAPTTTTVQVTSTTNAATDAVSTQESSTGSVQTDEPSSDSTDSTPSTSSEQTNTAVTSDSTPAVVVTTSGSTAPQEN